MLIRITSSDNSRIRLVRKLLTRKGRSEEGRFVAEGRNLIAEILERGLDVDFIMIPEGLAGERGGLIAECMDSPDITVCSVDERVFRKLTDAGSGIGMLAVVRMHRADASVIDGLSDEDNLLVLDRLQDPGNLGTIVRTAAAAGYKAIAAMSGTADVYSPKVLRATAGLVFGVPVVYVDDYGSLEAILRRKHKRIVVTVPEGGVPYSEAELKNGIALVIGNEGRGVSEEIMKLADVKVTLPMKGGVESLNAAVAAAILMYESVRGTEESYR